MNLNQFTIKSQEAIQKAQELASANSNQAIESIHILKGILDADENVIPFLLKKLNVNYPIFVQAVDKMIESLPKVSCGDQYLSSDANEVLKKAATYLKDFGDEFVSIEHLLIALLEVKSNASQLLKDNGIFCLFGIQRVRPNSATCPIIKEKIRDHGGDGNKAKGDCALQTGHDGCVGQQ